MYGCPCIHVHVCQVLAHIAHCVCVSILPDSWIHFTLLRRRSSARIMKPTPNPLDPSTGEAAAVLDCLIMSGAKNAIIVG